jgi:hypothetical protein
MWKASYGISYWDTHDKPTTSKIVFDDIEEVFHAKKWNFFHLLGKQLDYLHLDYFLKYKWKLYLKQPLTPPQCNIIIAYRTLNYIFVIDIGQ